jgi:ubiquinone/menaquinone biosynthesis C-methylase UbiE
MSTNSITKPQPHVCPHQISFFLDNWIRRLIQNPKKIVGPYIQEGDTVIDMGCGPGYFTIDMAKMVGQAGRVIAVDIQTKMLARVRKKAQKKGVAERIDFHEAGPDHIGLNREADFILAYYMIHETPDKTNTLRELKNLLRDGGKILTVEPKMHVTKTAFDKMILIAEGVGLKAIDFPKGKGGRSVVFSSGIAQ